MQYDVAEPRGRLIDERRTDFITWADRVSPAAFIMPAVLVILALSIFPLIVSVYLSLARVKFEKGGVTVTFIGLLNYKKLLFGSQQFHLIGTLDADHALGWAFVTTAAALLVLWLVTTVRRGVTPLGLIGTTARRRRGRRPGAAVAATASEGGQLGTIGVTLTYVLVGVCVQYGLGLGLALLCVQNLRGAGSSGWCSSCR